MTLEHHVKDAICPSCKNTSEKPWESSFWDRFHYITKKCEHCSYEIFVKSSGITDGRIFDE